jgi:hypothetical protein
MSEVINLRRARKRRAREAAQQEAAENRTRFGGSKEIRTLRTALEARETGQLEGHRRVRRKDDDAGT